MTAESHDQSWFDVQPVTDWVTAISEPGHVECVISWLIEGSDHALLLDTGMGVGDIASIVRGLTSKPVSVINSHSHWDHIGDNWRFDDIAIHGAEVHWLEQGVSNEDLAPWFGDESLTRPLPPTFDRSTFSIPASRANTLLNDGDVLDLGDRQLEVMHAPGHSPGGIVLLDRAAGWLFSTDVAYPSSLYAFGDDADFDVYRDTMRKLAALAPDLKVVAGSHDGPLMPPKMLVAMADALDVIAEGRAPDERRDDRDVHDFDGFRVFAPPTLSGERGAE